MTSVHHYKPVTHVIFDMDGLLLDSERHYSYAQQTVLARYGHEFTWELKQRQMGCNAYEGAKLVVDHYRLPISDEEYVQENWEILKDLFPRCELMPGAEKLVRHLSAHDIPICICTGTSRLLYELKTSRHKELFKLFRHVICSPDEPEVLKGKPEPDIFRVGAGRFRPPPADPSQVLVLEDAHNGVLAARSAGMQVVLVPDPRVCREHRQHATLCLDSLVDFKPELFSLPPY